MKNELKREKLLARVNKFRSENRNVQVAPSFLQLEAEVLNASNLDFHISVNSSAQSPTETRLSVNDVFDFDEIEFFLKEVDTNQHAIAPLLTWPNPEAFTADAGFDATHLEAIYNGRLRLEADSRVFLDAISMRGCYHIPQVTKGQVAATVITSADAETVYSIARDEYRPGMGRMSLPAMITLPGDSEIKIAIKLPVQAGLKMAQSAANKKVYAVLRLHGVISKAAAK